jgi:hypothetical protein
VHGQCVFGETHRGDHGCHDGQRVWHSWRP